MTAMQKGTIPLVYHSEKGHTQRLAGFLAARKHTPHAGDCLTAGLFAGRIGETMLRFKHIKLTNHDTITN